MILPASLRDRDVVAVNEYPANTGLHTGHVNLTFYRRGADEGTYGYNAQGRDVKGRVHPFGVGPSGMKGGVFAEPNGHAQVHYVVVNDGNYNAMLAVARSQALSTALKGALGYSLALNNCADFAFRGFAATDLSPADKDISRYLNDKGEPMALYAEGVGWVDRISIHETVKTH